MAKDETIVHAMVERGRIRLAWTYRGKRYRLSTGMPDTAASRRALQGRIAQIERDVLYGELDETLERYRSGAVKSREARREDLLELWQAWMLTKTNLGVKTLEFMGSFERLLQRCPYRKFAQAKEIKQWLLANTSARKTKQMLQKLATLHTWCVEQSIIKNADNPFANLTRTVELPRQEYEDYNIDPFTKDECLAIIQAYQAHPQHYHYANLIQFLLLTACRPSEAFGLRWRCVEKERIAFTETAVRVKTKMVQKVGTKTQPRRFFPINQELREFLTRVRKEQNVSSPDSFVFPNPATNSIIDYNYFLRSWSGYKSQGKQIGGIVRKLVVEGRVARYRSPYNLRHTAITWMLEAGITLPQIAAWVGNSPEVILNHYAGVVQKSEVPMLLNNLQTSH